ncbi:permease [Butyrivibrio sp. X503]|uniref:permease n=1 Tax=Butyrivibrio sp. X503 TaxID=2364878 RepID=UPI000EAA3DC7|nr:permease [Butyrivibrio sp. X503]RKM55217.1 permease [Butyrivibrio sp. X503]
MGKILKFLQDELLGMEWLATCTGRFLTMIGVDIETKLGGSIHFFIYDTIKIFILLFSLISIFGYIDTYIPPEKTRAVLDKLNGLWANVVAALFGTVTSFCSCSSIPIFVGFTNAGLPLGVTFSFLISSPMVDIASCVLLASVFGLKVAIVYVITGLIIAIVGGWIIGALNMESEVEEFVRKRAKSSEVKIPEKTQSARIKYGVGEGFRTIKNIWAYVIFGVAIGAVIHNWIPEEMVVRILGKGNPFAVLIATVVGAPVYADIFQTIAIAEALLKKGAYLGVILAFMMSITTLSLPSLIMLRKIIKGKLFFTFMAICLAGIMIVGYMFNLIQNVLLL